MTRDLRSYNDDDGGGWGGDPFGAPAGGDPFGSPPTNPSGTQPSSGWSDPFTPGGPQAPVISAGYGHTPSGPPPRRNWKLVAAVVAAFVVLAVGTGALLWGLNSGGGQSTSTTSAAASPPPGGTTAAPSASPTKKAPPPPLGAVRPPRDLQISSLEQAPTKSLWTYHGAAPQLIGGDSDTLIVGDNAGIIAVDAATGRARWPAPVLPDGVDPAYFQHSECAVDPAHTTIGCALNLPDPTDGPMSATPVSGARGNVLVIAARPADAGIRWPPMQDLERGLPPAALDWLRMINLDDKLALLAAFSGAARRAGKTAVEVTDRGTWGTDELARAWILLHAYPRLTPDELWAHGDNRERQAVLKALPLLPEPERFEALAVEACRSNVLTVFEAIACENPYPQRYFDEIPWNQMVLKAAFNGIALARILGLADRQNPELARMAVDFAAERRAAGRPVPDDLALVTKGTPA